MRRRAGKRPESGDGRPGRRAGGPQAALAPRTTANETFDLNIPEKRIRQEDYQTSASVEVGEPRDATLYLRVGGSLSARRVDLLLRNVRGRVRFRATLEPVLRRLRERQAPPAG